jgi:hypothetical protein
MARISPGQSDGATRAVAWAERSRDRARATTFGPAGDVAAGPVRTEAVRENPGDLIGAKEVQEP